MPTLQQMRQEVRGFSGLNLRRDRLTLADAELARSINADLVAQTGAIMLRHGSRRQYTTPLSEVGAIVRRLAFINGIRYRVVGHSFFRGSTLMSAILSRTSPTTIVPFQPINETVTWAFLADARAMRKDYAKNALFQTWGLTAPTATPTGAAGASGALTGAYRAVYTYVRRAVDTTTGVVGHESNPSPGSVAVTLAGQQLSLSGLVASTDPQVTHKRIYRTLAGGTLYLYDQEITNATLTATSTVADSALGALVETDNDPPPDAGWAVEWREHIWLTRNVAAPHRLWYSKRWRPESVPVDNFLEIGTPDDPLQVAQPIAGSLGVFSRRTKYRVIGSESVGFTHDEAISKRGTLAPNACIPSERGIFFVGPDGAFLTSLVGPDVEVSGPIAPLWFGETVNDYLPINWSAASSMVAAYFRGRFYLALPLGTDTLPTLLAVYVPTTGQWFFYDWAPTALYHEWEANTLSAGFQDRRVYYLEEGITDDGSPIAMDVETKDFVGDSGDLRKLFQWLRIDAETHGEALTVDFLVDGVVKRSFELIDSRSRALIPCPPGSMGRTWRIRFRYTGSRRVAVYAVEAIWMPLEPA